MRTQSNNVDNQQIYRQIQGAPTVNNMVHRADVNERTTEEINALEVLQLDDSGSFMRSLSSTKADEMSLDEKLNRIATLEETNRRLCRDIELLKASQTPRITQPTTVYHSTVANPNKHQGGFANQQNFDQFPNAQCQGPYQMNGNFHNQGPFQKNGNCQKQGLYTNVNNNFPNQGVNTIG